MVAPVGIGVDEFREESRLIATVLAELRRHGRASPNFHHVVHELSSLHHALQQLSRLQPARNDFIRLEAIRAMATRCRVPLEIFIAKIQQPTKGRVSSWKVGEAMAPSISLLQCSLQHDREIMELRSTLTPLVGTISLLLLTETVNTVTTFEKRTATPVKNLPRAQPSSQTRGESYHRRASSTIARQDARETFSTHTPICGNPDHHIDPQDDSWEIIDGDEALPESSDSAAPAKKEPEPLRVSHPTAKDQASASESSMRTVLSRLLELMHKTTQGAMRMRVIIAKLEELCDIFTGFTNEMREAVTRLMTVFQDIQHLLIRLNSQLPQPIDLPIVQFCDAFGNLMPFPLQLCQKWNTFHTMIYAAFLGKQGQWRVENGQFSIFHSRLRRFISPAVWGDTVKEGDKLCMSMIIHEHTMVEARCPWPSCCAGLTSLDSDYGGSVACPRCRRWIAIPAIEKAHGPLGLPSNKRRNGSPLIDDKPIEEEKGRRGRLLEENDSTLVAMEEPDPEVIEDLDQYRFVQIPIHGYDSCGALRAGACFVGTQHDEWGSCEIDVSISSVSVSDSFLSGCIRFKNLVPTCPSVTTYFEAEMIGSQYNFLTPHTDWGSDARYDLKQWREFPSWDSREEEQLMHLRRQQRQRRRRSSVESIDLLDVRDPQWWNKRHVYMRWKERRMVHPTTQPHRRDFNFDGFYYICFDQEEATIQGLYYQPSLAR